MSTSTNGNGNGNMGTGSGTMGKLLRLREQRAHELDALDTAIALLTGAATAIKRGRAASVLDDAIALDAARTSKRGKYKARKPKESKQIVHARRAATLAFLRSFDDAKPSRGNGALNGIPVLLRHGYLKRKGDGYVRTGREFSIERP
jgi:hypothetical protein